MKNPDKMSNRELRSVASIALSIITKHSGGGWDLQEAYGRLRRMFVDGPTEELGDLYLEIESYYDGEIPHVVFDMIDDWRRLTKLEKQVKWSAGLKCQNAECNDSGLVPIQLAGYERESAQCEFCWTVEDSVFSRAQTDG